MGDAFKCDECGEFVEGKSETFHYLGLSKDVKASVSFTFEKLKGEYGCGKSGEMCEKCLCEKMSDLGEKLVRDNSKKVILRNLSELNSKINFAEKSTTDSEIMVGKTDEDTTIGD